MQRENVAFLVAALAAPVLLGSFILLSGAPIDLWSMMAVIVAAAVSISGTLLVGVPAYLFLRARKWTAFWIAPVVGFGVAAATGFAISLLIGPVPAPAEFVGAALWSIGPFGAAVGALLWLIARPDRTHRKP